MEAWPTDSDLHAYASVPPEPRAVVLLLHGFGEHTGRHAQTVRAFARHSIAVYAYDQRGHGRSPGPRARVSSFAHLVDDSLAMRGRVRAAHPGLPLFLLGASMGGLVAIHSALRDPRGLAGVVLVSPALAIGGATPPVVRALGSIVAQVVPALPVASVDADALSRDRAVVAAFVADPLVHHGTISARTGAELLAAAAAAIAAAPRWRLPAYIIVGADDRIAAPVGARRFAQAAISADLTLRSVAGGYHEPFGEPGGAALVDEAATWVLERAGRAPRAADDSVPTRDGAAAVQSARVYTWREGLAFGAAINVVSRLLGTNTGRYEAIKRPWFAPPGWVFPVVWSINNVLAINGNLRVLNAPPSADRTAYLRLWAATWVLYVFFGYAFFRRKSPLLGLLDTVNFLVLAILSARRAVRIERRLWLTYSTLLPWLTLAVAVALAVALENPDPLLDPPADADAV
jgi:alpha-beta hydrolase superfamily lysophospholipase/tryptophan-rich sensory protein